MDVIDWLRGLGLAQYAPAFRDNDIDEKVLRRLTGEELRELGVVSLGHRRRLLDAIAALDASEEPPPAAAARTEAERRQLTVVFCDLVGSTALSARLDPEELREVIGAYHRCVAEEVRRFDGLVAKYMGDGVLVYFGYPRAHEDDAERAVRAGLDIVAAVARLDTPAIPGTPALGGRPSGDQLQVRIGIATGLVVVGDLVGEGASQEQAVVGETPNLAARLQALAEPGSVVIAPATRRLIGNLFQLQALGRHELKGLAEPVEAWAVEGVSASESRFEAVRGGRLTGFVGREHELGLLMERWNLAQDGEGQVVLLSGEPGIGKSRILAELRGRLEAQHATSLRIQCSPYFINSAFYPIIDNFERALRFARDDTAEQKLDELEALIVGQYDRPREDVRFIAAMLSIPCEERYGAVAMTPQKFKDETLRALVDTTEAIARRQPTVELFEDIHWADPTTLEVIDLLIHRVRNLPLLVVITHRPEFSSRWSHYGHVAALTLTKLTRPQSSAMVSRLCGGKALPADLLDQILAKTDGVPLFVEELTKSILESADLRDAGERWEYAGRAGTLAIPLTLRDSLMARLDHFAPVKEIAQIGAAIGREFSWELIAAVAPHPRPALDQALAQLTASGLAFQQRRPPGAAYTFKHALVQDAAYTTLLRPRRRQLHAAIAAALEREFPETVTAQPELLAHHCSEAGLTQQAVRYWHRAGERALERSANLEAVAHLTRGIELLGGLAESPQRDEQELMLQVALVAPLWATRGFGSVEAERAARCAVELSRRAGTDTPAHFRALYGLAYAHLIRGDLRGARPLAEQMLDLAERLQDPELLGYAHFEMGCELLWSAELTAARQHLEQGIAVYDPQWGRSAASRFAFNCGSNCHSFLGRVLWHLGYPDEALRHSGQAIAIAQEVSHPFSQSVARWWTTGLVQLRGEIKQTRDMAEDLLEFTTEQRFPFGAAHAQVMGGWALVKQGQPDEGIAQLRAGLMAYRATGAELESSHWLGLLAEASCDAGRAAEGLRAVAEALDHVGQTGIVYYEPELHRLHGELWLCCDPADAPKAEACFCRALEIARSQQAKSWELRAATSLARLWEAQGKRADARGLLAPVYDWFTEGFDTADLRRTKTLLDRLA
jgi:class 3 adenylate cyclase/predicted ATPase